MVLLKDLLVYCF